MDMSEAASNPPTKDAATVTAPSPPSPISAPASVTLLGRTVRTAPTFHRRPIRQPVRPPPASRPPPRTDLPYWLAWFLHAADLNELPIPPALFRRSVFSSPFPYCVASCVLYFYNVTQQYNRIRNPPLLAPHPQYQYSFVNLRRYDQCLCESWMAAGALAACGLCILLLSVVVLSTGPYVTLSSTGWRQEQELEQRQQEQVEQELRQRHIQQEEAAEQEERTADSTMRLAVRRRVHAEGRATDEDDDDNHPSAVRHRSNWACFILIIVFCFFFYALRHMATIKWPAYRHGILFNLLASDR